MKLRRLHILTEWAHNYLIFVFVNPGVVSKTLNDLIMFYTAMEINY